VGIIFLGTAQTFQKGGHIQIDLLTNRLSPKVRRIFRILTLAMGIIFLLIVTWETVASSIIAYEQERVSAVMIYPLWIPMLLIPTGLVIMMLAMGVSLIHQFRPEQGKELEGPPTESND
jgi:TRAP-type C4-dicarboxylate transport system permease small subunit